MKLLFKIGSVATINIVLGFLSQWIILTVIGPGSSTDALFAGLVVPQLVLAVVSSSLTHVLVPLLSNLNEDQKQKDGWGFFIGIGIFFAVISAILYLTSSLWIPLLVPGFNEETTALTILLTRIQLIGMVFTALTAVLWSVYHAKQKFLWVEISAAVVNFVSIIMLFWLLPLFGIVSAAWITLFKTMMIMVVLLPGLGPFQRPNWKSSSIKLAWIRIRPLILGTTYYKTDPVIDKSLMSLVPAGAISVYTLAQQLFGAGLTILSKAISTPMVPQLSICAVEGNWNQFKQIYKRRLLVSFIITTGAYIIFIIIGQVVLALLFKYGNLNNDHIEMLWEIMALLGGYWIGGALGQILSSSFYALGSTTIPTRIGVIGYTVGIVLKFVLYFQMGIEGLAIATSIYYFLNVFLLYIFLNKDVGKIVPT